MALTVGWCGAEGSELLRKIGKRIDGDFGSELDGSSWRRLTAMGQFLPFSRKKRTAGLRHFQTPALLERLRRPTIGDSCGSQPPASSLCYDDARTTHLRRRAGQRLRVAVSVAMGLFGERRNIGAPPSLAAHGASCRGLTFCDRQPKSPLGVAHCATPFRAGYFHY